MLKRHRPIPGKCPCCGAQEAAKGVFDCLHDHAPGVAWDCLERDALTWVDRVWQPQPPAPEQRAFLSSVADADLHVAFKFRASIAGEGIEIWHMRLATMTGPPLALFQWAMQHEYLATATDVPGQPHMHGWTIYVLSAAGMAVLAGRVAREGEG